MKNLFFGVVIKFLHIKEVTAMKFQMKKKFYFNLQNALNYQKKVQLFQFQKLKQLQIHINHQLKINLAGLINYQYLTEIILQIV